MCVALITDLPLLPFIRRVRGELYIRLTLRGQSQTRTGQVRGHSTHLKNPQIYSSKEIIKADKLQHIVLGVLL